MKVLRMNFTLVELLTVIAVIAILAGIAVPVIVGASAKGKETTARADMNAIKLALTQFKADYSVWPQVETSRGGEQVDGTLMISCPYTLPETRTQNEEVYDQLIQALTYNVVFNSTTPTTPSQTARYGNTRARRYLDPPARPFRVNSNSGEGFYKTDPWGRRYNIALDWDYNKRLRLTSNFLHSDSDENIVGEIAIYSFGTAENEDDTDAFLYSWRTLAR